MGEKMAYDVFGLLQSRRRPAPVQAQAPGGRRYRAGLWGQSFGINRFVSFVQTQRKLGERTLIRFRYLFENSKLFDLENIPEIEVTRNERAIRLGMLSAGFTHDTRDNALLPTRGLLYSADYSFAARVLGGNESFNKFFGNHQRYYALPRLGDSIFAVSARV